MAMHRKVQDAGPSFCTGTDLVQTRRWSGDTESRGRNSRWLILFCAALLGCAAATPGKSEGALPSTPDEQQGGRQVVDQFTAPEKPLRVPGRLDNGSDINHSPIRIWVYHRPDGKVAHLRLTGHASQEVCKRVTLDFEDFASQSGEAMSYFTFGMGDFWPRRGAQPAIAQLLAGLRQLAQEVPADLQVIDLPAEPDRDLLSSRSPPALEALQKGRLSRSRLQPQQHGPALVPLRAWLPDRPPVPLRWEVTLDELGVPSKLVDRLAGEVRVGPVVAAVDTMRKHQEWIEKLLELPDSTWAAFDDHVWDYTLYRAYLQGEVPDAETLAAENERLRSLLFKFQLLRLLADPHLATAQELDGHLRKLNEALYANAGCLRAEPAAAGASSCWFYQAEVQIDQSESARRAEQGLRALRDRKRWLRQHQLLEEAIEETLTTLERHQQRRQQQPAARDREAILDAVLRHWPVLSDPQAARRMDETVGARIRAAWPRLLARLKQTGVDLSEPGRSAGVLSRANLFYRVRELGAGRYEVAPEYVVYGPYTEHWDLSRGLVTIEVPNAATAAVE